MLLSAGIAVVALASRSAALGTSCNNVALGAGTAGPTDPFWLETISHQGSAPFSSAPSTYKVFRNVKDFGAVGDGVTDDTAAINLAITTGSRYTAGGDSSTTTPAVVYFPKGTYAVSGAINALYYTQLVGDARTPPTLQALSNFTGAAVIDADPLNSDGTPYYAPKTNFYRSVRNLNIDLTRVNSASTQTGIHWRVSKGTSLANVAVQLSTDAGTGHQGVFIEDGSGGFLGDLVINGGKYGLNVGNQQFTVRNVTVNNAQTGVSLSWAYGWTFQDVSFNNVTLGFDIVGATSNTATQAVGSVAIIDSSATSSTTFLRTSGWAANTENGGSIVLNNIILTSVPTAVADASGSTPLAGGSTTIAHWEQGTAYVGTSSTQSFDRGSVAGPTKPASLLNSNGNIVGKSRPQYADYASTQFISVKSAGAHGDGQTDDTAALQAVFNQYSGCKIIFFDAGVYVVTNTLTIPTGTQVVGEGWSVILGKGSAFSDVTHPKVVVQVGTVFSQGVLEISDIIFSTQGAASGAIVVEWNAHEPSGQQAAVGAWDTQIRLGSGAGSDITSSNCPSASTPTLACDVAFLGLHLTPTSSAYLEGLSVWLAEHDLDNDHAAVTALSGRGVLSESQGPVWLIGTAAEHHAVYQYNLYAVNNHYLGFVQGETPSYETSATRKRMESFRFKRTLPISPNTVTYHDPIFDPSGPVFAWGLWLTASKNVLIFGGGFYSPATQNNIVYVDTGLNVKTPTTATYIYALNSVGATNTLTWIHEVAASANQAGGQGTIASWTSS